MILEQNTQERYTPDVGVVPEGEEVCCGVCGDKMNERRNCLGARGYAQAMSGGRSCYDEFECPNIGEKWHEQVIALRRVVEKTPSKVLATLLQSEAEGVLKTRKETKEFSRI